MRVCIPRSIGKRGPARTRRAGTTARVVGGGKWWCGLLWTPRQLREGPRSSGGGQLLPAARVLPAPARCGARPRAALPAEPELWRSLHHLGHPASAHPRRPPPGLLTCGPEGAGGPGPGLAGCREELFPRASGAQGSAARGQAAAPSAAARLSGAGPGLRGAPGVEAGGPG